MLSDHGEDQEEALDEISELWELWQWNFSCHSFISNFYEMVSESLKHFKNSSHPWKVTAQVHTKRHIICGCYTRLYGPYTQAVDAASDSRPMTHSTPSVVAESPRQPVQATFKRHFFFESWERLLTAVTLVRIRVALRPIARVLFLVHDHCVHFGKTALCRTLELLEEYFSPQNCHNI